MKTFRLKLTLIYNFVMPALLLNSVAIVILKLVDTHVTTMSSASWLESFKDGSIVVCTFLLASFIPKLGYRKSLIVGVLLEIGGCVIMALHPSITTARIFFAMVGTSFAFIKVSVYSSVGLITKNENEHASFMLLLEGFFITGFFLIFWLFGFVMKYGSWANTYWLLAIACSVGLLLLLITPMNESALTVSSKQKVHENPGFIEMFRLLKYLAVLIFLFMAFSYVFIEQGLTTWLPTYDKYVLHIVDRYSVEIASLFAGGLVIGRIAGAFVMKYLNWHKVLMWCTALAIVVLVISIYMSTLLPKHVATPLHSWSDFPLVAYLIPVMGILLGPIYPTLCSSILSSQPVRLQSSMSALIVITSALGGTIGSKILGTLFGLFGGLTAIKVPIFPLVLLLVLILPYYYMLQKFKKTAR